MLDGLYDACGRSGTVIVDNNDRTRDIVITRTGFEQSEQRITGKHTFHVKCATELREIQLTAISPNNATQYGVTIRDATPLPVQMGCTTMCSGREKDGTCGCTRPYDMHRGV